ncbi:MAG: hypothetical protein K2X01_07120 [Cyanobacteria bacterium]|nr:hypothetical protein [Cyanobacteriota bacterium]
MALSFQQIILLLGGVFGLGYALFCSVQAPQFAVLSPPAYLLLASGSTALLCEIRGQIIQGQRKRSERAKEKLEVSVESSQAMIQSLQAKIETLEAALSQALKRV